MESKDIVNAEEVISRCMTSLDLVQQEHLLWTTGGDVATYSSFLVEAACPWGLAVYVRSSAELACHPRVIAAVLANEGMRSPPRPRRKKKAC